ncbi:MAG: type II toxin-antitoxin system Phd/YefM family antitoxin [Deltaproteobacteria bacterium]|nr:type II toxin-antitoxin system Phd/YefM family antitoxin [Deltaproteobacteria bacterium]
MIHSDKILPVTQVKRELMKLLKSLQNQGGVVAITKDGQAAGILMSPEEYEGLLETLEILHDQSLLRSLHRALKESRAKNWHSHQEVFED